MAKLTIEVESGGNAPVTLGALAKKIEAAVGALQHDRNPTGEDVKLTIDNKPKRGLVSVRLEGGGLPDQPTHYVE